MRAPTFVVCVAFSSGMNFYLPAAALERQFLFLETKILLKEE